MEESINTSANPQKYYNERILLLSERLKRLERKAKWWITIRLVSFSIIPLTIYFLFHLGAITFFIALAELILFLFFVRKSAENKEKLNFVKNLIWINTEELKVLSGDFSAFNDGEEYVDPNHAFSYDLDLFGKNNFFQFFNRTVTKRGEKELVNRLLRGDISTSELNNEHEAIEELTRHITWSQKFRASCLEIKAEEKSKTSLDVLSQPMNSFPKWIKVVQFITPIIGFGSSFAYYFDLINGLLFSVLVVIALFPVSNLLKRTNKLHKELSSVSFRANAMKKQLHILEEESFKTKKLSDYQQQLFTASENCLQEITALTKLIEKFEYRNNILVAVLLNFYFAWDLRMILSFTKWKKKNEANSLKWEAILFEFEALISAANFRYNNKDVTVYPAINKNESSSIEIESLGHPLIPDEKLVKNDFEMTEEQHFAIVTGPNMAGKSTFLRSVGLALVMAKAGFPVMAKFFYFPNLRLYSSMRTSDNLSSETSYFHAELIRLRFVMDAIEDGEKVFIILDEILKGTNSKDKEEGSAKFLTKLVKLKAKGIIATHDLSLTELAKNNKALMNRYFDTKIEGDNIDFDYTIREGVAKNMNASFLLKKMNLVD